MQLTFPEIERIIGTTLPPSARTYSAWWANEAGPTTHIQCPAWTENGWLVSEVKLSTGEVVFEES